MSSTSNVQDLLVNVFRPTYRYVAGTGFVPSLVMSNVTEVITGKLHADSLVVSDSNLNTYIGSNAGTTDITRQTASNVAIGYAAMAGPYLSSNNTAIGYSNFGGLSNANSNVGVGTKTTMGRGVKNVLIGPNINLGDGSGNIIIGSDISVGSVNNRFQLGQLLYGDLSAGKLGVNTTDPQAAFDISGITVFRNKVGFQQPNPVYSLDVNGSVNISERLLVGSGTSDAPIYTFKDVSGTGLYQATDASYGTGALGITIKRSPRVVVTDTSTYVYGGMDVCGTITSSGGSASFLSGTGSATEPAYSFKGFTNLGIYRTTDPSGAAIGIAVGGTQRLTIGSNKLTMFGNLDVCGALSAVSGGGGGSGTTASNGTAAAPSFTFSNDSTTGLYLAASNKIGIATGGVLRVCISGSAVGVGTLNPQYGIDVSGAGVQKIQVSGQDAAVNIRDQRTTDPFVLFQNNSNQGFFASNALPVWMYQSNAVRMVMSNGNVGIGTTAPGSTLDVSGVATLCNAVLTGALRNALTATTFDISGGNISNSGTTQSTNALVSGYLRNALVPTQFDISGGNISNSGTTQSVNVLASGYVRNALTATQFDISGGNISNSGVHTTTGLVGTYIRNALVPTQFDISGGNLSNSNSIQTGNPVDKNLYGTVEIGKGYSGLGTNGTPAMSFQYNGGGFRHFIRSRHDTAATSGNAIDFYTNTSGTSTTSTAPGTGNALAMSVTAVGVGIGTSAPGTLLDISTNNATGLRVSGIGSGLTALFDVTPQNGYSTVTTNGYFYVYKAGTTDKAQSNKLVQFAGDTGGAHYFASNNVGIGTTTPGFALDVSGTANIQTGNGAGILYLGGSTSGVFVQRDTGGNGYLRASGTGVNLYLGTAASNTVTVAATGSVGIGTTAPAYTLDICASAGTPTLNVTTWPRIPLSNALLVKGVPGAAVGNTLNFNTVVRSINSTLATFTASNATSGGSLLINKAGIWSIVLAGSTGTGGSQLWMDISTNNHSNIAQYTNGNPVLAIAYTPGTSGSNNTTCSFIGYLPSNVYVKARLNGSLGADADVVWRLNAIFHAETDAQTTWPF